MNRCVRLIAAVLAGLALVGCGSVPPAPVDRFYRLAGADGAPAANSFPCRLALRPLRAESLYAERPIVYADAGSPRQLRQYPYHLWLYPPAQLIGDHLAAQLGAVTDDDAQSACVIEGRVLAFDRVQFDRGSRAVVALELRLYRDGAPGVARRYRAEEAAGDVTMESFVQAMERALVRIQTEFVHDAL